MNAEIWCQEDSAVDGKVSVEVPILRFDTSYWVSGSQDERVSRLRELKSWCCSLLAEVFSRLDLSPDQDVVIKSCGVEIRPTILCTGTGSSSGWSVRLVGVVQHYHVSHGRFERYLLGELKDLREELAKERVGEN